MSDTFAGLTRRINERAHDRDTAEELSHIVEEAQEIGGEGADAVIELALDTQYTAPGDDFDLGDDDSGLAVIVDDAGDEDGDEDDEVPEEDDPTAEDGNNFDDELDELEADIEQDSADDTALGLGEAARHGGEILVF